MEKITRVGRYAFIVFLGFIVSWLVCGFVSWDFNIGGYTAFGRGVYLAVTVVASIALYAAAEELDLID